MKLKDCVGKVVMVDGTLGRVTTQAGAFEVLKRADHTFQTGIYNHYHPELDVAEVLVAQLRDLPVDSGFTIKNNLYRIVRPGGDEVGIVQMAKKIPTGGGSSTYKAATAHCKWS